MVPNYAMPCLHVKRSNCLALISFIHTWAEKKPTYLNWEPM